MSLSVVIPVYNEEKSIETTILKLHSILKNIDYELIVVNDCSIDMTKEVLKGIANIKVLEHSKNKGYGASIKNGIKNSKYDFIAITDADGTYPNERLIEFYQIIINDKLDMVVGSRTGSNVNIPLIRKPAKWFIGKLANYVVDKKIPDINSGLRIFKKSSFLPFMKIIPDGFSLTTTLTLGMLSGNYELKFLPIDYFTRSGKSKIRPIHDTLNFIKLILKIGLYFAPLKIFLPISFIFLFVAVLWGFISKYYLGNLADVSSLIIAMTGFNIAMLAFISELINHRLPNDYRK